jgi:hypothetical protein
MFVITGMVVQTATLTYTKGIAIRRPTDENAAVSGGGVRSEMTDLTLWSTVAPSLKAPCVWLTEEGNCQGAKTQCHRFQSVSDNSASRRRLDVLQRHRLDRSDERPRCCMDIHRRRGQTAKKHHASSAEACRARAPRSAFLVTPRLRTREASRPSS